MSESEIKSRRSRGDVLDRLRAQINGVVERDREESGARSSKKQTDESEPPSGPFEYIQKTRRAIRMKQLQEAGRLIEEGLERYPDEPHLVLEWSKFLEHRKKDYDQALEYALKVPDEIEGASNKDRRVHRLRRRATRDFGED